ncbi:MAG: lysoplasmalogenase [Sandaracinaceae bacterium]
MMTALVAVYLWALSTGRERWEWLIKPAAALTFIATALFQGALSTDWGTALFVGLLFAAGGDILLIPKDRRAFLGGLVSFLIGHLGYAVAFGIRGLDLVAVGMASVGLVAVGVPIMRWLWPHVEGPMRGPVLGYVLVITAMVALSIGTFAAHGNGLLVLGAVGFYFSDLAVARQRFVSEALANRLWGLPLYFYSQLILASAV